MLARHGRKLAKARRPDDLRRRYSILDHSGSPVLEGISLGNAERVAERYAPGGVKVWFSGDSLYTDGLGGETAARVRAMFRWPPLAVKEPDESCAHAVARAIGEHNEGRGMYVPDDAQCRDGVLVILGKAEEDEREQIWHVVMGVGWADDDRSDGPRFEVRFVPCDLEEREAEQADGTYRRGDL